MFITEAETHETQATLKRAFGVCVMHTVSEIAYLVRNCCAVAILMKIGYNT